MSFTPTRREFVFLLLSLLIFLSLSRFDYSVWHLHLQSDNGGALLPFQSSQVFLQSFRSKLSYVVAPLPETKVLANVPGKI